MSVRSCLEWAAIVAGIALAYPLVRIGGSLDQAIGPLWILTLPVFVLLLTACAWGRPSGTSAGRQTVRHHAAEAPNEAAFQTRATMAESRTVH